MKETMKCPKGCDYTITGVTDKEKKEWAEERMEAHTKECEAK